MNLHAHLHFQSRDCDGHYEHDRKEEMTAEEKASDFGDLEFKRRITGDIVSVIAEYATLRVDPDGMSWEEDTEEGFRAAQVEWCEENCEGSVF